MGEVFGAMAGPAAAATGGGGILPNLDLGGLGLGGTLDTGALDPTLGMGGSSILDNIIDPTMGGGLDMSLLNPGATGMIPGTFGPTAGMPGNSFDTGAIDPNVTQPTVSPDGGGALGQLDGITTPPQGDDFAGRFGASGDTSSPPPTTPSPMDQTLQFPPWVMPGQDSSGAGWATPGAGQGAGGTPSAAANTVTADDFSNYPLTPQQNINADFQAMQPFDPGTMPGTPANTSYDPSTGLTDPSQFGATRPWPDQPPPDQPPPDQPPAQDPLAGMPPVDQTPPATPASTGPGQLPAQRGTGWQDYPDGQPGQGGQDGRQGTQGGQGGGKGGQGGSPLQKFLQSLLGGGKGGRGGKGGAPSNLIDALLQQVGLSPSLSKVASEAIIRGLVRPSQGGQGGGLPPSFPPGVIPFPGRDGRGRHHRGDRHHRHGRDGDRRHGFDRQRFTGAPSRPGETPQWLRDVIAGAQRQGGQPGPAPGVVAPSDGGPTATPPAAPSGVTPPSPGAAPDGTPPAPDAAAPPGADASGGAVAHFPGTGIRSGVANILNAGGLSDNAVAGILRNIQDESGFRPGLRHPDQPRFGGEAHFAHGLYQEGGDNWNRYAAWLQHNGASVGQWSDPKLQTQFLVWNLQNNYPQVWQAMNSAATPAEAAQIFLRGYLRPSIANQRRRAAEYSRGVPDALAALGNQ